MQSIHPLVSRSFTVNFLPDSNKIPTGEVIVTMNARRELIEKINSVGKVVKCWSITIYADKKVESVLKRGYSSTDYDMELNKLRVNYDAGFGIQHLYGHVLFEDDTWLERYENDGNERWVYMKAPSLPECE